MRQLLLKLHLFVALIAGVFIAILGLTGAIMAFDPELDHLLPCEALLRHAARIPRHSRVVGYVEFSESW